MEINSFGSGTPDSYAELEEQIGRPTDISYDESEPAQPLVWDEVTSCRKLAHKSKVSNCKCISSIEERQSGSQLPPTAQTVTQQESSCQSVSEGGGNHSSQVLTFNSLNVVRGFVPIDGSAQTTRFRSDDQRSSHTRVLTRGKNGRPKDLTWSVCELMVIQAKRDGESEMEDTTGH